LVGKISSNPCNYIDYGDRDHYMTRLVWLYGCRPKYASAG